MKKLIITIIVQLNFTPLEMFSCMDPFTAWEEVVEWSDYCGTTELYPIRDSVDPPITAWEVVIAVQGICILRRGNRRF